MQYNPPNLLLFSLWRKIAVIETYGKIQGFSKTPLLWQLYWEDLNSVVVKLQKWHGTPNSDSYVRTDKATHAPIRYKWAPKWAFLGKRGQSRSDNGQIEQGGVTGFGFGGVQKWAIVRACTERRALQVWTSCPRQGGSACPSLPRPGTRGRCGFWMLSANINNGVRLFITDIVIILLPWW